MSTTKNLGLFKHDNPATNTDEFNVDKALNQNWDKLDTAIGTDRERITTLETDNTTNKQDITNIKAKDTEQDKYIAELEAENARLREDLNGLPKGQASGESIDLSDSAEMRCDLKISGNSKQETSTQGKNLLTLRENEYTAQGANVTLNKNQLIIDGTVTSSGNLLEQYGDISSYIYLGKFPSGTYRFSKFIISGSYTKNTDVGVGSFACYIRTSDKTSLGNIGGTASSREGVTITLAEDTDLYIQIYCNAGAVFNNYVLGFQLEEGDTTTELEDFIPNSPSPDYTSEVECCGDNINLFDKDNANILSGVYVDGNGYLNSSNKTKSLYIPCKKNTTYSISKILSSVLKVATTNQLPKLYLQGTLKFSGDTSEKCTITTSETDTYIVVYYYNSSNDTLTEQQILNSIKIVEGTETGGYSPYGQGCINEVICNDNLFDKNNLIPYTIIPRSNGVAITNNSSNYEPYNATDFIPVKENTNYFINFTFASSNYGWCFYDKNKNFISGIEPNVKSFATPKETAYLRFCYDKNRIDTNTIQLVEGSTEKPYVEHKEQIYTIPTQQPFRSIGDIRDTFIKKNNKWYERHYVERLIFDGTEGWNYDKNNNRFYFAKAGNKGSGYIMSSHYKKGDTTKQNYTCEIWTSAILFRDERFTEREDFINMIKAKYDAGTPIYTDIVLQEPQDIECTEEQSTILFDIEQNAKTYDKVTHMYSTDNVSPVIDVTYKKDIETMITNIEQAILSQGGNI